MIGQARGLDRPAVAVRAVRPRGRVQALDVLAALERPMRADAADPVAPRSPALAEVGGAPLALPLRDHERGIFGGTGRSPGRQLPSSSTQSEQSAGSSCSTVSPPQHSHLILLTALEDRTIARI